VCYICDKAISTEQFPSHLRYPIVKLIFNKGDMENFANCRPVSIMTSFSKVSEKIMYSRLLKYINNSEILVNEQFGFRSHSSAELASYDITYKILKTLNNKVVGIFFDLEKAFECVSHVIFYRNYNFME
jgi:hypothetical protein